MLDSAQVITIEQARRLAVVQQRLARARPAADKQGIEALVRHLGCVQIDPMRVVERNPLLVLWSRIGPFDPSLLDELLFESRALFEGWAHAASIVHREHLPIHRWRMRRFATGERARDVRVRQWLAANERARADIREQLSGSDPRRPQELDVAPIEHWRSDGWSDGRNLSMLLDLMWRNGEVMVGARDGLRKLYVDAAEWFEWEPEPELTAEEAERCAVRIALRGLGLATERQISNHFTRDGYPDLDQRVQELVEAGDAFEVAVVDDDEKELDGPWYLSAEAAAALEDVRASGWQGRTTLLSPFDNLIADRERTRQLWNFDYKAEIYVPKAQRVYGHYVMPILHGASLAGRVDPQFDRNEGVLRVKAIHYEPGWAEDRGVRSGLTAAAKSLASFLGADAVAWPAEFEPAK